MAAQPDHGPTDENILHLLATAEADIRADRLSEAVKTYEFLLSQPGLGAHPSARTEVCANYGALLLHEARLAGIAPGVTLTLDRAIALLSEAQRDYGTQSGDRTRVITETNLALAYVQRHFLTGSNADLMSAHLALDAAEARALSQDRDILEWIASVRTTLVHHSAEAEARR